jgi:hypothetical protein
LRPFIFVNYLFVNRLSTIMTQRILDRLEPDTAPTGQSVWYGINRKLLEHQSQALFKTQHVAGRRCYTGIGLMTSAADTYHIPLEIERSLTDDFAFIAASQPQVDSVSAVAMELDKDSRKLIFRLAANEGVTLTVKSHFDQIFAVLRSHARKGGASHTTKIMPFHTTHPSLTETTQASCEQQLFDEIVKLNCNKILGRLGSKRFKRPPHLIKNREPLTIRLRHLIHRLNQASPATSGGKDLDSLSDQICSFEASFSRLEEADPENVIACTKFAIGQAFMLTENGVKLPERLAALGCPKVLLDARDVREVGKISNYWRISRHLTKCARRLRPNFVNAEWYAVQNYKPSCGSQILRQRFVHAEIQILAYYEMMALDPAPRIIGVSKEACFLCDSFIRAHGIFSLSGAHRQMVSQWTVPDLKEYSSQTILRIRRALSQVCEEVTKEYLQSQRKHSRRCFPLQSAINLDIVQLPTPSVSTLCGNHSSEIAVASTTKLTQLTPTEFQNREATQVIKEHGRSESSVCRTGIQQQCEAQDVRGNKEQELEELPINIAIDKTILDYKRWINIVATCLPSTNTRLPSTKASKFLECSISIEPVSRCEGQRVVRLDDIPQDGEITVSRDASDAPHELLFVLVGRPGEEVQIRCQWRT